MYLAVHGVTEELTRDSLVVVASIPGQNTGQDTKQDTKQDAGRDTEQDTWLRDAAHVFIAVELPFGGTYGPRVLDCAATVSSVRPVMNGMRIKAEVHRMTVTGRDQQMRTADLQEADMQEAELQQESLPAARSRAAVAATDTQGSEYGS